ncbi:FecR domain-containing protein [Ideonella sp. 4Y16]|uniref:FecR domain-containing protein n=1 Tax=Ideonella alba TaxID=2824118 RepID=A0A941BBC8_9BURK|nr:FecR domain-containing protein [Ideonella alba]MBQ0930735.1 FecR domain-containing protein [Ideonella alba]MBQ0944850.1 FecR domain-containing protein [Ideonella alba]
MNTRRRSVGGALAALLLALGAEALAAEAVLPYTVQPHDTLIGLGRDVLISPQAWPEVARLNRLPNPNLIRTGQVLQMPLRLLRSAQAPARLDAIEGSVRLAGREARAGDTVLPGQALDVAANSSAVLILADGSRLQLAPLSQGELSESQRYLLRASQPDDEGLFAGTMRLLRGTLEVLATKLQRAKPLEVTTPTAVIGVRGTEYRVRHEDQRSVAEVLEGRVQADVGASSVLLDAGFGSALQPGLTAAPVALPPAPDLSSVPTLFERPVLRFKVPGNDPLRVQVAADAGFSRILRDERFAAGAEARLTGLPDGDWYLRVRRSNEQGLEGRNAQLKVQLRARPEPPAAVAPVHRGKLSVGEVALNWAENTDAARYRIELSRDPAFATGVQRLDGLSGARTTLTLSEPGTVHWRLASLRADGSAGPWGDAQQFELRALPTPPSLALDGNALTLAWSGRPEDKQQVQLAREADFATRVAEAELSEPRWQLAKPEQPGTYYFRYRTVEPDGFTTPWSSTQKIELPRDWRGAWGLLLPLLFAL